MVFLESILYLLITALLALFYKPGLIYFSVLTGALPLFFVHEGWLSDDLGSSDINSIRVVGLWLAAFIVFLTHHQKIMKYISVFRFHLLFLLFCISSLFWTTNFAYGMRMILKLAAPLVFLLMMMMIVKSERQIKNVERSILIGASLALLIAVMTWNFKIGGQTVGMTIPTFGPSLSSAFFLIAALTAWVKFKYERRLAVLILTFCFVAAVFAGFTRITIVALFIGFSVILFMSSRGIPRIILPVSGILGLPALFLFNETLRKRMFFQDSKINLTNVLNDPTLLSQNLRGSGRFHAWDIVISRFVKPSPLIGSGVGTTQSYFYSGSVGHMGVVHSEYVRLLADVGGGGLTLFVIAFLAYLFLLTRNYYQNKMLDSGKYALAAVGGVLSFLIYMATDNALDYINGFGIYIFTLVGLSLKSKELEDELPAEKAKWQINVQASAPVKELSPLSVVRKYPIAG